MKKIGVYLILILTSLFLGVGSSSAKAVKMNATLEAVLILKMLQFNKTLKTEGEISFFIIDNPELSVQLEKAQGQTVGGLRIGRIEIGIEPPDKRYSVIYCGAQSQIKNVIEYSTKYKSLSVMTGQLKSKSTDLTVTFRMKKSKADVYYNKGQSKKENMRWEREFLKLAKIVG